jgi:hypothetical protein
VPQLHEQLAAVSTQLGAYLADSEEVFLDAGERLSGLQARAQRLVEAAGRSAALAAHTEAADPVASLEAGLDDLRRCLAESRRVLGASTRGLVGVLRGIDELTGFRPEFQRAGVTLWTLAISTRIENARGEGGGGFETVVADVRRLGAQIEPKFEAVLSRVQVLRGTAAGALSRAQMFLDREAGKLVEHVDATSASVAALRATRSSADGVGRRAAITTDVVAGEVTGILTTLQMHDIARQMIEHVRAELDGLADGAGPAEVAALATLEASQLGRARETLTSALGDIAARLGRISSAGRALGAEAERMAELREGTSLFDRVDEGIARSAEALREQLSRERFTTSAICRVSASMIEVATFAREIEVIGSEVKLIALNAQVQAEKAGDTGRALAVLARAVRELSVDVEQQTSKVAAVMARISDEAGRLGAEQALEASQAAASEHIVADTSALLESLHRQHRGLLDGIESAARDGADLEAEVGAISRALAEDGERAEGLRELEDALVAVGEAARALAGPADAAALAGRLHAATERYTMEHERAVHRSVAQGASAADRAAPQAPKATPSPAASQGLGDNVELF